MDTMTMYPLAFIDYSGKLDEALTGLSMMKM
jgi:hypothetical protein